MTKRWEAYQICKERGHQPGDVLLTSDPPQNICKHCGTYYRVETRVVESNVPSENDE